MLPFSTMNVVITGASRGIGLEFCRLALAGEARVLAVARQPGESRGLNELLGKSASALRVVQADVSRPGASETILTAAREWGPVDVLINNAGVYRKGETAEDFAASFAVNAVAPFQISKALLPCLRKSSAPKLVQITSLMGSIADNASGGSYAYRASKTALNMFNKCLAIENDWLVAAVLHPGWVQTDMGGTGAPVTVEESVRGMWKVIQGLRRHDTGGFFDFRGKSLPW